MLVASSVCDSADLHSIDLWAPSQRNLQLRHHDFGSCRQDATAEQRRRWWGPWRILSLSTSLFRCMDKIRNNITTVGFIIYILIPIHRCSYWTAIGLIIYIPIPMHW
ncbi:hypothetical protein CEXT_648491 [Caerostris extrusa]|uniref:Uncharacterized protein n=1 Tax=Caerostris extrusa TaxID=172846 RepID=A0AAV4MQ08_CAEEX|nr:hypothetical protein CEXT_648491 [Caerostris extrusa]